MNSARAAHQIPELPNILIDGFRHKLNTEPAYYILTHFHSDHYMGLSSTFNRGTIICTSITANLICTILKVDRKCVRVVEYGDKIDVLGTKITFMDANHCPGACIILFETKDTSILHTGDMRYHPSMKVYPALVDTKVDRIYLDTTYAHPKHVFLTQELAIEQVIEISSEFIVQEPNGVVLLCAYNLGKEKLITAVIDKVLNNAYIDDDKFKIFQCLTSFNDRISNHQFVTDKTLSRFHICKMGVAGSVMPYFKPNFESLELYHQELIASGMDASKILCIVPSGWAHSDFNLRNSRMEHNNSIVQLVPYSEHSNFNELKEFVRHFKPRQVIPTVYRNEDDRMRILDIFQHEMDATLNKQLFIEKLTRVTQTPGSKLKEESWQCSSCTYVHREKHQFAFLACELCLSSRYNKDSSQVGGVSSNSTTDRKLPPSPAPVQSSTTRRRKRKLKEAK